MLKILICLSFSIAAQAQYKPTQNSLGMLAGEAAGQTVFLNLATTSVTSGAYVQVATLSARATAIELYESAGTPFYFATGSSGAQANKFIIVPGGVDRTYLEMPAATKIWLKAASAGVAPNGIVLINFYGQ